MPNHGPPVVPVSGWKVIAARPPGNSGLAELIRATGDAIQPDDHSCYFNEQFGIGIFGEVFDRARIVDSEVSAGGSQDEAEYTADVMLAGLHQGMAYGECFSRITPDGEVGSTSTVVLTVISAAEFEGPGGELGLGGMVGVTGSGSRPGQVGSVTLAALTAVP